MEKLQESSINTKKSFQTVEGIVQNASFAKGRTISVGAYIILIGIHNCACHFLFGIVYVITMQRLWSGS